MSRRVLIIATIALLATPAIAFGARAESAPAGSARILNAVSCATPTFCVAVGTTYVGPRATPVQTLIQRWNGKRWSAVPSLNPPGAKSSELLSVSCASAISCFAVGRTAAVRNQGTALVLYWNGTAWSLMPTPTPNGAMITGLYGVSCTSPTFCVAAGRQYSPAGGHDSLIELWDGMAWSIVPSHNPGPSVTYLHGVSCRSTINCFTVGEYIVPNDGDSRAFTERWNGKVWSVVPSATNIRNRAALGVSCPDSKTCMAVGSYAGYPIAERWNGKRWSDLAMRPAGPVSTDLASVSCARRTYCFAVGRYGTFGGAQTQPLIQRWNGNKWSIVAGVPAAGESATLHGVSCATTTSCFAVGQAAPRPIGSLGRSEPLIERFDGKRWANVASPK